MTMQNNQLNRLHSIETYNKINPFYGMLESKEEKLIYISIAIRAIPLMLSMGHSIPCNSKFLFDEIILKINEANQITPIDITALFGANDFHFLTDVIGFLDNINSETGNFVNGFSPIHTL